MWPVPLVKDPFRDIAKKDAERTSDRNRLLNALTKTTERNERLPEEQDKEKEKYEEDLKLQPDLMAALDNQNDLLKQRVKDQ